MSLVAVFVVLAAVLVFGVSALLKKTATTITVHQSEKIDAESTLKSDKVRESHSQEQEKIKHASNDEILDRLNDM